MPDFGGNELGLLKITPDRGGGGHYEIFRGEFEGAPKTG